MSSSKFKDLFADRSKQSREEQGESGKPRGDRPAPEPPAAKRAPGKRSDPDYEQVTAYLRKQTYRKVKMALLEEDSERQFSDLVEDLLTGWLKRRKTPSPEE